MPVILAVLVYLAAFGVPIYLLLASMRSTGLGTCLASQWQSGLVSSRRLRS